MRRTHAAATAAALLAVSTGAHAGQQEGRISSTTSAGGGITACAGHQGWPGDSHGATDRLHRHPCRSWSRGRCRCSGIGARNDRNRSAESRESRAAGACGLPVGRQRVRPRRGDWRAEVSLRAENRIRDPGRESADRAGRHPVRPGGGEPARHLADGRLRISCGSRRDAAARLPKGMSARAPARRSARWAAAAPMKGGLGTASIAVPAGAETLIVGAIVAVNAVGDVIDPRNGSVVAGVRTPDGKGLADARRLLREGGGCADTGRTEHDDRGHCHQRASHEGSGHEGRADGARRACASDLSRPYDGGWRRDLRARHGSDRERRGVPGRRARSGRDGRGHRARRAAGHEHSWISRGEGYPTV